MSSPRKYGDKKAHEPRKVCVNGSRPIRPQVDMTGVLCPNAILTAGKYRPSKDYSLHTERLIDADAYIIGLDGSRISTTTIVGDRPITGAWKNNRLSYQGTRFVKENHAKTIRKLNALK